MKVIAPSKLPRQHQGCQLSIAAQVEANFDEICARIGAKAQLKRDKLSGGFVNHYKSIYFQLSTGAFASLTQEEKRIYSKGTVYYDPETSEFSYSPDYQKIQDFNWPNVIDIELQTNEIDVVYDEDLIELVSELGIDMAGVRKATGNFTWRKHRRKRK
jgi:hypothetical protein